jgi:hypothetical protein
MDRLPLLFRLLAFAWLVAPACGALDLSVASGDVRVDRTPDGYILHVRKKPDIASVLLTEDRSEVPSGQPVYSLRAPKGSPVGAEKRVLDGREVDNGPIGSLVDSTPVTDAVYGTEFKMTVPATVCYGYAPGRHGELIVRSGAVLNIRTFEKPFADYSGRFKDNTFVVPAAVSHATRAPAWAREIASASGGRAVAAAATTDLAPAVSRLIGPGINGPLDVVFCIETTSEAATALAALRSTLVPALQKAAGSSSGVRYGIVYYRDYLEEYLTRTLPLQTDLGSVQRSLDVAQAAGGRGGSDAAYEALWAAAAKSAWRPEAQKLVILIAKLPPHAEDRGGVSKSDTYHEALASKIRYDVVVAPD